MYSVVLAAALLSGGGASGSFHGYYGYSNWSGYWGYQAMPYGCYGCNGCIGCTGCQGYGACGGQGWYGGWGGSGYGVVVFNTCCGPYISPYNYCPYIQHPWDCPTDVMSPELAPPPTPVEPGKKIEKGSAALPAKDANRARLVVTAAADVKLYVNGRLMQSAERQRLFHTPELTPGQNCTYTLRGEAVRDGKTVSETKRIVLKVGEMTRTTILPLPAGVAVR